jgi:hypothetical protein
MRVYGNLINRIQETAAPKKPEVGMGATILMWSDRHAATIVEVSKDGKRVVIQEDNAVRTDKNGMSECQDYTYSPNPNAAKQVFTLRKNGTYVQEGSSMRSGTIIRIGERDSYHDFSF